MSIEKNPTGVREMAILLYDRMSVLDAIGPYEVLRSVPGVRVRFVAKQAGLIKPDSGLQMLNAEAGIADVKSADVLVVPGGDPSGPMRDPAIGCGTFMRRRRGRPPSAPARYFLAPPDC